MDIDKISEEEQWMEDEHTKDEYESHLNEFNTVVSPIMTKVYGSAGGSPEGMGMGVPEGMGVPPSDNVDSGPSIDEVD